MAYQNTQETLWIERFFKLGSWILLATSLTMTTYCGTKAIAERTVIQQKIADRYQLPLASTSNLQCYQGYLHYPNRGLFSGLLAINPSISCNAQELEKLYENQFSAWFATYSLLSLILLGLIRLTKI